MTTLRLPAPAKLNLFLHVTGRRADGYHDLESVFVPITLADTVTLRRLDDGQVRLIDPPTGIDEHNDLACRAARALQRETGTHLGVDITLEKRIPVGGGLGGGSSDAATTLLGLNRLWSLNLPRTRLKELAATLGADVPFFVFGQPALARGVGERLLSVSLPFGDYCVAFAGKGVATAGVFSAPDLVRNTPPLNRPIFGPDFGRNDLQPVAERLEPGITELCAAMRDAGLVPRMTGSGACVFAALGGRPETQMNTLAARLPAGSKCWLVRSLPRHPLYGFADGAII